MRRPPGESLVDALADLVTGSRCVGCEVPGRMVCSQCWAGLGVAACHRMPDPVPQGLLPAYSAGVYEAMLRELIIGHKDRSQLGLSRPLGILLGRAVRSALAGIGSDEHEPVLLVPVPSRPGVNRRRGHDPTGAITDRAVRLLRRSGRSARVGHLLVSSRGLMDQVGLDSQQRLDNLSGSMSCPSYALQRVRRRTPRAVVVICDDILTTGATAREAQRALENVGIRPAALATVAATQRQHRVGSTES